MALDKKELEIVNHGKASGKNSFEVLTALRNYRTRNTDYALKQKALEETKAPSMLFASMHKKPEVEVPGVTSMPYIASPMEMAKDAPKLVTETYKGIEEAAKGRREMAEAEMDVERPGVPEGLQETFTKGVHAPFAMAEGALGGLSGLLVGAGKVLLSEEGEKAAADRFGEAAGYVAANETVQNINASLQQMKKNDPVAYSNVMSTLTFGEAALELGLTHGALQTISRPLRKATFIDGSDVKPFMEVAETAGKQGDEILQEAAEREMTEQATLRGDTTAVRLAAEREAPSLTLRERAIGLRPDQVKRLRGNEPLITDYINVAKSRNNGDFYYADGKKVPIPSPLGYGAQRAQNAADILQAKLDDTGSLIGGTRERLATTRVDTEGMEAMETAFTQELNKLNLTVRDGKVVTQAGRNPKTKADGDIRALQQAYEQMQTVKQAPNLQNYYELQSILDGNINYAKTKGEGSNSLDGVSRGTRKAINENTRRLLGSEYATRLDDYKKFMDAYSDLKAYTDRKAGGEYILRLLDSGRSREADELIRTIDDRTGIDLKDDAMMANLVTDMFGNPSQKTQFTQELQKIGVVVSAAQGDMTGWLGLGAQGAYKLLADEEKILIQAAKQQPVGMPISPEAGLTAIGAGIAGVYMYDEENNPFILPGAAIAVASMNPATRKLTIKELQRSADDMYKRMVQMKDKGAKENLKMKHQEIEKQIREIEASFNEGEIPPNTGRQDLPDDTRPVVGLQVNDRGAFGKGGEEVFNNFPDLTAKHLSALEGKGTVNKQFILDTANRPELKQPERDLIRAVVDEFPEGKINVQEYADKIKARLLPLEVQNIGRAAPNETGGIRYERFVLPDELRGNVANYGEKLYESPIENSAGGVHFDHLALGEGDKYFAHSRIEDMADGKTRRVIEAQSDLFQKGRLEGEIHAGDSGVSAGLDGSDRLTLNNLFAEIERVTDPVEKAKLVKRQDALMEKAKKQFLEKVEARKEILAPLQPYRNTWWERIIREEVRQAGIDGKKKLQFPTGETAMKIEGLGDNTRFLVGDEYGTFADNLTPQNMKVGGEIFNPAERDKWIITEVLDDGKFKAVPKRTFDNRLKNWEYQLETLDGKLLAKADDMEALAKAKKENPDAVLAGRNPLNNQQQFIDKFSVGKEQEALDVLQNRTAYKKTDEELAQQFSEEFDISGKVDTKNPIYKFYEKDMQKYLKKNYNAKMITDENGVTWVEMDVPGDAKRLPIEAFGIVGGLYGASQLQEN
jgi:hypothetical protein